MSALQHRLYTHADLLAMPDDGKRYEIVDGELFVLPSPILPHQELLMLLGSTLFTIARQLGAGSVVGAPMDVILDEHTVVQPDLMFIRADRKATIAQGNWITGAPDIVMEVISPSSERHDRVRKYDLYERFGVSEYWLFDLETSAVTVHRLVDGRFQRLTANADGSLTSLVLPALTIDPATLFTSVNG